MNANLAVIVDNLDYLLWGRLADGIPGGVVLTLLLLRPLTLMGLDDGVARNLGLALSLARLGALTLAIVISALLVNAVGIIGFIGLFAPLLAKMLGARRLLSRLLLAALIGALLLWLSDQVILWLARVWMEVSTGSVTALIGAPLLLWLLPRLRSISAPVMCHQCENAPCVGACPVGALTMGEQVVQTNSARCIGCQSCVSACPFGMITIQSLPGDTRQQIVKCDLCEQREEGPACVESCPTQALQLLTERELRRVRQQRIVASGENPL